MFRNPWMLLAALPVVGLAAAAVAAGAARRRRLEAALGESPTLARLLGEGAPRRRGLKTSLRLGGLFLLMAALAGPQWGVELVGTTAPTRDVVIAVDVSASMLAEDVRPNRLGRALEELSLLIDELKGARVGVVAFAGEAVLVCPLTADAPAAKQLLRSLRADSVGVPGTGIGKALRRSLQALARSGGEKSVVLLTDGEDHKSDPLGAAKEAAESGVTVYTIGIGSAEGQPIPLKDESGAFQGYKKDKRGAPVMSRLGEKDLAAVAEAAGGAYYRSTPGASEASEIAAKILAGAAGKGSEPGKATARRYRSRHMIPLALAFLLLLLEWLLPEGAAASKPAPAAVAASVLLLLAGPASAATAEGALRRGNRQYRKGEYERALESYAESGRKRPKDARPIYNAGAALYRMEKHDEAAEAFKAAAGARELSAASSYNLGNALFRAGDYKGAVEAFRRSVALDPKDESARRNLAVALRRLKNPPPPKQDQKKDDKKKDQPPPKPDQDKSQGGGGQPPPQNQPKTRPQDQLSKEDAERIMRAVRERERAAPRERQTGGKKPPSEEDW